MDFIRYRNVDFVAWALLCSSLALIHGAWPLGSAPPPDPDPCSSSPCQNRALCRSHGDGGGYSCFCVPGFQGSHCHIDVNECVSEPCSHGATCLDRVGSFSCVCPPGFTGDTCEVQADDDCQSQPCLNGGSCRGDAGGFTCTCPPGFQGQRCQIKSARCLEERPCHNGAPCVDAEDGYRCDCSGSAFTGALCETPLSPCHSQPCLNGALCQDQQGNYTCHCSPGSLCQEPTDPCDPGPCQNGGRCESHDGAFTCHCPGPTRAGGVGPLFGGPTCELRLVGCEGHECQNQGSCSPFLSDGTHGYTCACGAGFSGPLCATPTAFSFERPGHLLLRGPLVDAAFSCNVTLSFRTVLPDALLFQRRNGSLLLSLELAGGRLRLQLTLGGDGALEGPDPQVLELPHNVTDGEWHSAEVSLERWTLSLRLLDGGGCLTNPCHKGVSVPSLPGGPAWVTFIGGVPQGGVSGPPPFIGCMRDVLVDWQLVLPENWRSHSAVNVSPGCSRRDRCLDRPCQNQGRCVNLWQSYRCACPRPYQGRDCEEEHVTARFGNEDSRSFATFSVSEDLGPRFSVSLFLRTRRPGGLLLALTNSGGHYLQLWLEDGRAAAQAGDSESLRAEAPLDDGEVHFLSLEVDGDHVTLRTGADGGGGQEVRAEVGGVRVRAGDAVYVGGLLTAARTAALGGYFKGCVQDLRLDERTLNFFGLDESDSSFPLENMMNVVSGCDGDNACSTNPCLNGGVCFSMWDDFTCTCPPSTAGRRCEDVRWCEMSPCPADAECRMLDQGYECYSNATFLNNSTVLSFRGNGQITRNLTNLSLNLRTRRRHAAVLHAERGPAFVTLSIQDGFLVLELQSSGGADPTADATAAPTSTLSTVSLSSRQSVSDGEWHSVQVFMAAPWAHASRWTLVLDEDIEEARTSRSRAGNLDFLREGVDVFVGGLAPDAGWSLAGCLSTVELGGVALSYLAAAEVNLPRLQDEQFVRSSLAPPLLGCGGAPVCEPNPCLNGGECHDRFNAYDCSCGAGWAGPRCDFFTDTCASGPCRHGNCSVVGRSFQCRCHFGYAGVVCDQEVDMCQDHLCARGGTCLHGPDRYACLCPENYTGPLCHERIEEIPWYIVVRNVRPKLPVSVCGDDTRNYTCFNGGNCTERELTCDCPPGFIGHRCEQEVDECQSNPCLNGGYCRNLINKFICICDMSFAGDVCQMDVSDIYFYVALLLWQNLFQLLSYLILRLDDEPEIDWGGDE